jgi:hypothetical protein
MSSAESALDVAELRWVSHHQAYTLSSFAAAQRATGDTRRLWAGLSDHVRGVDHFVNRYGCRAFGPWLFYGGDAPENWSISSLASSVSRCPQPFQNSYRRVTRCRSFTLRNDAAMAVATRS